jgi:hypothetical protein
MLTLLIFQKKITRKFKHDQMKIVQRLISGFQRILDGLVMKPYTFARLLQTHCEQFLQLVRSTAPNSRHLMSSSIVPGDPLGYELLG